jgi:phosphate acetyltransferase
MRAMLQVIRPRKNIKTVSSYFMMVTKVPAVGVNGTLIFSDAGLVPDPTSEQLVDIAAASADSCRMLLGVEPAVGFLSFSTKGSAKHPLVDKVVAAVELFRKKYPNIQADGELQLDSAIIPSVAARKCKDSKVAGRCNVLIFPDLNAGNIGYKLTERLGGAQAIGPLVQGLAKPGNDLSRGCSVSDIVNAAAVACVQSQSSEK